MKRGQGQVIPDKNQSGVSALLVAATDSYALQSYTILSNNGAQKGTIVLLPISRHGQMPTDILHDPRLTYPFPLLTYPVLGTGETADGKRLKAENQYIDTVESLEPTFAVLLSRNSNLVSADLPSPLAEIVTPMPTLHSSHIPLMDLWQQQLTNDALNRWFGTEGKYGSWTFLVPRKIVQHVMSERNDPYLQYALQNMLCGYSLDREQQHAWNLWREQKFGEALVMSPNY